MSESPRDSTTVGIVGTKIYTRDCLDTLLRNDIDVDHLVTLSPAQGEEYGVAGYHDLRPYAEDHSIEWYHPESYGLNEPTDQDAVNGMSLDLLLVAGWSRLVPESILESITIGALGAHGSPEGLPKGRGRAVLNWALIEGETTFSISTFFLEPGVDDGPIVDTTTFEVNEFDTASTLRYKTWMVFIRTIVDHFDEIVAGTIEIEPQTDERATYYPKRKPEDGAIDWSRTTEELHRFVRALTRPYPGAFTYFDGDRVDIWEVQPFDERLALGEEIPGHVLKVFTDGELLVETGDSALLVTDYEGIDPEEVQPGDVFESVEFDSVLAEIQTRYPSFVDDDQKEI